ncbi:hypothetical protein BIS06_03200, partial [Halomonas sp. BBD48]|nr:hypothetical protein [Halomonas sp. BBD48]
MREALAAAFQCRYRPMALMMVAWLWVLAAPASGDEVREADGHRHHSAKHDERGYGAHAEPR